MSVELNHTIVAAVDSTKCAEFLAAILGLDPPDIGHFAVVALDNGVNLDYEDATGPIASQHYAFLVDDEISDHPLAQVKARGLTFWANPWRQEPDAVRTSGGRGFYFDDPSGHLMEVRTQP